MDKIYPRLKIVRIACHCGALACRRVDGLPWRVYHIQFEGQLNPLELHSSLQYETSRQFVADKLDNRRRPFPNKYYVTAS